MDTFGGDYMYLIPNVDEIKKKRKAKGLSKCKLSIEAGLGNQALSRIERQETKKIHPLRAKEIARVLDCNVNEIFKEE